MHPQSTPSAGQSTGPDWHGWRVGGTVIHVGYLPGRKSCCLYTTKDVQPHGAVMDVLAYFRSEEHAKQCLDILDRLVDA